MSGPVGEGFCYVAITPVRNEADNLPSLAASLAGQTLRPREWLIVDNGSTDGTAKTIERISREHPWVRPLSVPGAPTAQRGGPVVRAFHAGLAALAEPADIVVKLDADVSCEPDYFERLLTAFADEPLLGMASGGAFERDGRQWVARPVTRGHVWGPCRAYRWECLQDVLPLEERMGWDGVDELKAGALGWRTGVVPDLWFWHHRLQGRRDGARRRHWQALGDSAHFMHYRFSYLVLRALYRARGEPVAIAMIWGYLSAVLRRQQQCSDSSVREVVRRQQSFRRLPLRVLDALRRRTPGRRPPATPELRRSSSV